MPINFQWDESLRESPYIYLCALPIRAIIFRRVSHLFLEAYVLRILKFETLIVEFDILQPTTQYDMTRRPPRRFRSFVVLYGSKEDLLRFKHVILRSSGIYVEEMRYINREK